MKETIENNSLLAEFLGSEIEETVKGEKVYCLLMPDENDISGLKKEFFAPDELKFYKSWDWLMLVVDRINEVSEVFRMTSIEFLCAIETKDFNRIYKSCVEYVKWFNSQNK